MTSNWQEDCAEWFDAPLSSREHAMLRDTGWLAGNISTVRYSLGRLLGRNLFRNTDAEVSDVLRSYVEKRISKTAAALVVDDWYHAWMLFDPLLQYDFHTIVEE